MREMTRAEYMERWNNPSLNGHNTPVAKLLRLGWYVVLVARPGGGDDVTGAFPQRTLAMGYVSSCFEDNAPIIVLRPELI